MQTITYNNKRVIAGLYVINIIEWYGFTLFALFALKYLALFFPTSNQSSLYLIIVILFASAFILRPIGGIIFSHIADRFGRLNALTISVVVLIVPTIAIGLLPTYKHIGVLSPILLVVCRALQGLSVGGEFPGSFTFAVEYCDVNQRGIYGGLCFAGAKSGMLLAAFASTLVDIMNHHHVNSAAWRIPFIATLPIAIVGYYFLSTINESQAYLKIQLQHQITSSPLTDAVQNHRSNLLFGFMLTAAAACCIYQIYITLSDYLIRYLKFSTVKAATLTDFNLSVLVLAIALGGYLADKLGIRLVMLAGCIGIMLMAYPIYHELISMNWSQIFIVFVLFSFVSGCVIGPLPAALCELFPIQFRCSAVALSYNLAFLVFGGAAPFINYTLIHLTHSVLVPMWFIIFSSLVSIISIVSMAILKDSPL